jgi:hypothetical protein
MTSLAAMFSPTIGGVLAAISPHLIYFFAGGVALLAVWVLANHRSYDSHSHF